MSQKTEKKKSPYRKRQSVQRWIVMGLAAAVIFGTTRAMMLPAMTLEMLCGISEHTHMEGCFDGEILICEIPEHIHTGACGMEDETQPEETTPEETVAQETGWEETVPEETEVAVTVPEETFLEETIPGETVLETEYPEPAVREPISIIEETVESQTVAASADPGSLEGDQSVVSGGGIRFRLFNYSTDINKTAGNSAWRPISSYFTFRNSSMTIGTDPTAVNIPTPGTNSSHDEDGFTTRHATVERLLDGNGNPVLDLTRNADGTARTDPGVGADIRSLAYLFSNTGDLAVTAYRPSNTILKRSGTHYVYKSNSNAVDYDPEANLFRVRGYTERNSTTAGYGASYGDFLPFTYTGGTVVGTTDSGVDYHVLSADTDYWFGMTMEVSFFQTKDGSLGGEDMIFHFSGDDDVWVFVDGVLVLDLGGTHGTVDGYINFATGEVRQYLSWNGANTTEEARKNGSATSFPTTIRACFDAAGQTPNGGWSDDGQTFADYTEHTLKFFYLERGSAVANCILDFALPTLPDKSLTVTKDLAAEGSEVKDFIADRYSYRFRVVKADDVGNATGELFIRPGMTYDLLENGVKTGTGTVDADGYFELKAGQSAQFTEMLLKGNGAVNYIVQEVLPDSLTGQYAGVEYEVSGSGGETQTEEGPAEDFTSFSTRMLSAEQTQTVTFRNKVDVSQLGNLKITKKKAEGAVFEENQQFSIQLRLGGELLAKGTEYSVSGEMKTVTESGVIPLKIGETAEIPGILSGTAYEVTELGTADGNYHARYSGTVTPAGTVNCTADGAFGVFPLAGTVHVTVTNASYDFSLRIPISKRAIDNGEKAEFKFLVEQVAPDTWTKVEEIPGTSIVVTDDSVVTGGIVIGYDTGTEGVFYYKIREQQGSGSYIYDETFYIVEVTVADEAAAITKLLKNGREAMEVSETLSFVNRRTTSLIVSKRVIGAVGSTEFPFTVTVLLNGEPFLLSGGGNTVEFSLAHGEAISIPHIPIGAVVTVTETSHDGFFAYHQVAGIHDEAVEGDSVSVNAGSAVQTVHFTNESGYELPDTGSTGTKLYTTGGMSLAAIGVILLLCNHTRRGKEEDASA